MVTRRTVLFCSIALAMMLGLAGCSVTQTGRAAIGKAQSLFGGKTPEVQAQPPANAEQPTVLQQGETKRETTIRAGTKASVPVKVNGQTLLMEFEFPEVHTVSFERLSSATISPPRAPDVSVQKHQIDAEEKRPFLYASIAAALLAVVALFLKYPAAAALCGLSSAGFFAMWKLSDLPSWFVAVAVAAIAVAVGLWLGFERGERSKPEPVSP